MAAVDDIPFQPPALIRTRSNSDTDLQRLELKAASSDGGTSDDMVTAPEPGAPENKVQVVARFRPENEIELREGQTVVDFGDGSDTTVRIDLPGSKGSKQFEFDRVFRPHASQQEVFDVVGEPTVNSILSGFNACLLAYGQTGSTQPSSLAPL